MDNEMNERTEREKNARWTHVYDFGIQFKIISDNNEHL